MTEAVGYARISRAEAGVESLGISVQAEAIRAYCAMRRLKLHVIYQDLNVSGGKALELRAEGAALVDVLRVAPRVLVAYRQDRLFRSIDDAVATMKEFRAIGVDVVCIAEGWDLSTPAGRLLFHIMAATGEYEREIIGVRTRDAMKLKKERGERVSRHAPYGFRFVPGDRRGRDGSPVLVLERHPEETDVVNWMREKQAQAYSYRRIAEWLNIQKIQPRHGKRWGHTSVRKILAQEAARRKKLEQTPSTNTNAER